jgi:hypothetical protein
MFWFALTVLALLGGVLAVARRRRYESVAEEPWRASLRDDDDDEFDAEALRRAEEELDEYDDDVEEPWRG